MDEVERPLPQQEQEVGGEQWPDLDLSPAYKDGIDVVFDEDREQGEQVQEVAAPAPAPEQSQNTGLTEAPPAADLDDELEME